MNPLAQAKSGLVYLRDAVAAYFVENSIPATVTPVGLKYRSFTLNQSMPSNANRIVIIPGEFDGDASPKKARKYGMLSRETRNASASGPHNPRELLNWERPFTVSIWSAPSPGHVEDVQASLAIVEDLLEQFVRAANYAQAASLVWGQVLVNEPPVERPFGCELLVSMAQRGPLYDVQYETVRPQPAITKETL